MKSKDQVHYSIIVAIVLALFFRLVFFSLNTFGFISMGGQSDADYYNDYAIGVVVNAVNFWPVILRWLYDMGLYSREWVSGFLVLLSTLVIPFLFDRALVSYKGNGGARLVAALAVLGYPTLFFYSLDIYRDVFMLVVAMLCFLVAKKIFDSKELGLRVFLYVLLYCSLSTLAFYLRGYLGAALFLSFFIFPIARLAKNKLFLLFGGYVAVVVVSYVLGFLDPILLYRGEDGFLTGGATLGIGLYGKSVPEFIVLFAYSFVCQVFGFFITGPAALFVFVFESMPFIFCLIFVLRNWKSVNGYCFYLMLFSFMYSTVWVLGNDNLGTAVRLRVFTYIPVFISFFIVYIEKKRVAGVGR